MVTDKNIERIKRRIRASITVDVAGCWIWEKTRSRNGYGTFAFGGGKNARAHRVSYQAFVGAIPTGFDICHKCDVRSCVNPEHLFAGTRSENILDAAKKNRVSRTHQPKGSRHPSAKLSEADVLEILRLLRDGVPPIAISERYQVTDTSIRLIAKGRSWRHVERSPQQEAAQ